MSNVFSRFEDSFENAVDAAAGTVFKAPIEPAQIAKKAEKQMKHNRLVGAGRQYAPTLYNVLVSSVDDKRLFGFYPTMASEIETYLMAKGADAGLDFDGRPLVRFIIDETLRKGKFDVIAENVAASVIRRLREEEMEYYGIAPKPKPPQQPMNRNAAPQQQLVNRNAGPQAINRNAGPQQVIRRGVSSVPPVISPQTPFGVAAGMDAEDIPRVVSGIPEEPEAYYETYVTEEEKDVALPSKGNALLINTKNHSIYPLGLRRMNVGRGADNDVVVNDANASRVHAQLIQDATGTWKIVDLNSTNGTLLNDRPITQAFLSVGDRITIGLTTLEFEA